ncbi:MAG: hypothetical protein AAGA81_24435 [Acidobacteriota bacterium]
MTEAPESGGGFSLDRETSHRRRSRSGQTTLRWILRFFMVAAIFALALQRGMPMSEFYGLALLIVGALFLPVATTYLWRQFGRLGLEGPSRWVATIASVIFLLSVFALAVRSYLAEALGG